MADTSQAEQPPHTNGISEDVDEDDRAKIRPADIDADVREMERRKRVENIMNSRLFREELERIIELQLKDGSGTSGLMQQISDMMGGVSKNAGNAFKNSNCVVPINDIRGIEAMGYAKGEKILRCKLAAVYRLIDLYGWTQGSSTLITARLNQDEEHFLVNPYGMLFHEMTASALIKADMQGQIVEQGTTNFGVNLSAYSLHAAIHAARPDIKCIIHVHTPSVVAVSALKCGLLPISQESVVIGEVSTHAYVGALTDSDEKEKIARNLGPNNKVLLLNNQGAVCCGETIEEAFYNARNTVLASESQLKLMPVGIDNLVLLSDEARKKIYDAAHKAPDSSPRPDPPSVLENKVERKWRVGGVEFEALMRMLDNAGFRTGYIYRHPLVKGDPPKPRNDVELPPAVSSLGYLLEEEELYKQGLWKKMEGGRKGFDRTRWLNSPNVYQKVEILETGTPDPKKITKWVAEESPTHSSTPVKIDSALQFVPKNTNPKEFKKLQQQIKDYRRADKISAGPQSQILEGVTWEEAKKMQDAGVTQTGDQVVLMGAASKGIIQRGFQHNATMYKSPYSKNPFDSITDEDINEYKRVVERKTKGEYDTDYSESEGLSSAQINKRISDIRSPTSETEEESRDEPQVLRIETKHAPKPSQPEVVLSDVPNEGYGDDDVFYPNREFTNIDLTSSQGRVVGKPPTDSKRSTMTSMRSCTKKWQTSFHRTTSFFGFPKGSYTTPRPVHYHYAQERNVPVFITRPLVNSNIKPDQPANVGVKVVGDVALNVDVSMKTMRNFIYPFARALDLINTRSAESQTSYVSTHANTDANFERSIVKKMHENLLTDFDSSIITTNSLLDSSILSESSGDSVQTCMMNTLPKNRFSAVLKELELSGHINLEDSNANYFISDMLKTIIDTMNLSRRSDSTQKRRSSTGSMSTHSFYESETSPRQCLSYEDLTDGEYRFIQGPSFNDIPKSLHRNFYVDSPRFNPLPLSPLCVVNEKQTQVYEHTKNVGTSPSVSQSHEWSLKTFEGKVNAIQSIASVPYTDVIKKKTLDDNIKSSHSNDSRKSDKSDSELDNAYSTYMVRNLVDLIREERKIEGDNETELDNARRRIHLQHFPHYFCPSQDARCMPTIPSDEMLVNSHESTENMSALNVDMNLMKHLAENASSEVDECMNLFFSSAYNDVDSIVEDILIRATNEKGFEGAEENSPTSSGVTDDTVNPFEIDFQKGPELIFNFELPIHSDDSGCDQSITEMAHILDQEIECFSRGKQSDNSFYTALSNNNGSPESAAFQTADSYGSYTNVRKDIVNQMSDLIIYYMRKSCLHTDEVVLFPEVQHDENVSTLFAKLENLFNEYFKHSLSAEEVSELRIELGLLVLRCTNHEFDITNMERTFAISEFVSDLLDYFFEKVVNLETHSPCTEYENFHNGVVDQLNSTPDDRDEQAECETEEMASFQLKQQRGNECYWFSALKPSERSILSKSQTDTPRVIINVDEIPLRPPPDLNQSLSCRQFYQCLSPIQEIVPTCLTFDEDEIFAEETVDIRYEEAPADLEAVESLFTASDDALLKGTNLETRSSTEMSTSSSHSQELVGAALCEELQKIVPDFDKESTFRLTNEVHFLRSHSTLASNTFSTTTSVVFNTDANQQRHLNTTFSKDSFETCEPDDDHFIALTDNWLGLEKAKF